MRTRRRTRTSNPQPDTLPCLRATEPRPASAAQTLAVCWATDYEGIGNSYGYSVHNARSREALVDAGVRVRPDAPIAVHVAPAHLFHPLRDRINVLYMAWETDVLPAAHRQGIARADVVIVTASFLVDVLEAAFPGKPVYLCHEGVDTGLYSFRRRQKPLRRPFRFLWVGAPNARKGWELVLAAWKPFEDNGRAELYLKTTVTNRLERYRNVIFDSRNLAPQELVQLYHSAHAFLFPSFGEGFGLTMAEAMATGLPVAYTPWSSLSDLADESCAYPLRYKLLPAWATPQGGLSTEAHRPNDKAVRTRLAQAETAHLAERAIEMFRHYPAAVRKGHRAARRIRERFTWKHTGRRLAAILQEVMEKCPPAQISVPATM